MLAGPLGAPARLDRGAAPGLVGSTALHASFAAEQGKGLILAGLAGVFIVGSLGTIFTIVYGMSI